MVYLILISNSFINLKIKAMNTKQEVKLRMYLAVRDFLILNESITKDLPEFTPRLEIFLSNIKKIQLIGESQKEVRTGLAKNKSDLRNTLITLAADNSRKVYAFADNNNNKLLMDEVSFSISDLGRKTDVALKDYAEILYKKANSNIDALAIYGITPQTQKVLSELIEAYDASLAKPRLGISEKSQATNGLRNLFNSSDTILEKLDNTIGIIRLTQNSFYNSYRSIRKLIDTNSGNIALKATAIDMKNRVPLKGVIFTFIPADNTENLVSNNGEIIKRTAEKGIFHIKNMKAGTYRVMVKKPGYKEQEVMLSISSGERSQLNVELEKV
jgi:hypothetical protein